MNGFSNEAGTGGNAKYANFKKGGLIQTRIDGEMKTFTHLTGNLWAIDLEDSPGNPTYKIEPYRKIVLYIQHDEGVTMLGFPFNSGYGQAFLKILPNINVSLPVKISGGTSKDDKGTDWATLFVQQGGKYVPWYYKKDSKDYDKVPKVKMEIVGKGKSAKEVKDYTDRDEFFERLILRFQEKLATVFPAGAQTAKAVSKGTNKGVETETEPIDDLPF